MLQWVSHQCRKQLDMQGWICDIKRADMLAPRLRLIHRVTGERRETHEILDLYREIASRSISLAKDCPISLNDILRQFACLDSPPSHETLIKLLEYTIWTLDIDPSKEFYVIELLVRQLKQHTGPNAAPIRDKNLHTTVSRSRACFFRSSNPNCISVCNRCNNHQSLQLCFECGDFLCGLCSNLIHSKGSRRDHSLTPFEQPTCSECAHQLAHVWCTKCRDLFCDTCYLKLHPTLTRSSHVMELPYTCACSSCTDKESSGFCENCLSTMCDECSNEHIRVNQDHKFNPSMQSTDITILVALFQRTQWPTTSRESTQGILCIQESAWYDSIERKTYTGEPTVRHDGLHAAAVESIMERTKLLKH